MHVAAIYVVSLHPDDRTYVDNVPDMQADANAIMTIPEVPFTRQTCSYNEGLRRRSCRKQSSRC